MSADRELLELAAKAAGYEPAVFTDDGVVMLRGIQVKWSPKHDDGDSLRLAVALGLQVSVLRGGPYMDGPCVEVRGYETRRLLATEFASDNGASLQTATRLAILHAAAEIGRRMP